MFLHFVSVLPFLKFQSDTFSSFESMTDRLVEEILGYLSSNQAGLPSRISFVGHSLGTVLIRSVSKVCPEKK